jgi:hypothetical protein
MYRTSVLKLIMSEPLARFALAIPAIGTLIGSCLMIFGGLLPCLIMDAVGLLFGLVILTMLLLKYLWIEHLLLSGETVEAKVTKRKDLSGIQKTTELEYQYLYDGVKYKKTVLVHLPEEERLKKTTVIIDPDRPESGIIRELYCVQTA